jgi:ABC-type spermidine/putrescine transport system permease subunit I
MTAIASSDGPLAAAARTAPRRAVNAYGWVVLAFLAGWTCLLILPLLILFAYSFFTTQGFNTVYEPSLDTWTTLVESGRWLVGVRTLGVALAVTAIILVFAFPFALWLSKGCRSHLARATILTALTIPFFLEITSRTVVWRAILGTEGIVNSFLGLLGTEPQSWMLYSGFAVHFGMVLLYFPSMVFPIFMAIELIDDQLIGAAEDLGASPAQVLRLVILPLALPGVVAGTIFTLAPTMAEFVVPQLLGGFNLNLLGNSINSALGTLKYPMAAALSAFVLLVLIALLGLFLVLARRIRRSGGVFVEMRQ